MPQAEANYRAFVAGATGYTGRHVVEELVRANVSTHAHVRAGSGSREQWVQRLASMSALVDSTQWEQEAMNKTLQRIQPTHVFSLLGTTRSKSRADKSGASSYMAVDYGLSVMLLQAAIASGSNPCFTFLSSLGATVATGNQYLKVRGLVEEALKVSGLPYLIVQPAIITGPDRGELRLLEPLSAKLGDSFLAVTALFGSGRMRSRYSSMTGGALARGIVDFALRSPRQPKQGRTITFEDIRNAT